MILCYISASPWIAFKQSDFKFVDMALSFFDAMKFCRADKGDLASTASEERQTFVFKTFLEGNPQGQWIILLFYRSW